MSVDTVNNSLKSLGAIMDDDNKVKTADDEDALGRDAFLTMLVAQMENQDPLNPMEGTDFSAQLAQFSSLEQLFNLNDTMEGMAEAFESQGQDNVLDYIGKEITSEDNSVKLKDGSVSSGLFTLSESSEEMITIYDNYGQEVMSLYPGELQSGTHQVDWDGYDYTGSKTSDGTYRFEVTAISESGSYIPVKTEATGLVTGVIYDTGTPYLVVDDRWVDPSTVVKVWDPETTTST